MEKYDLSREREFLEDLLQNVPPYSKRQIDFDQYNNFANLSVISIDSFCEHCGTNKTFTGDVREHFRIILNDLMRLIGVPGIRTISSSEFFSSQRYYFPLTLKCAKCNTEHIYVVMFEGNNVLKVGQYPSYISDEIHKVRKYKNIISKYYIEFTKSINCYSQGNGVAAFVYLRRILEWLIDSKYHGEDNLKFIDKLKVVESVEFVIPPSLDMVKNQIYSILSKGVHEYCEDECLRLYPSVKFVIEQILDKELEKKENERKAKEAIRAIGAKLKE